MTTLLLDADAIPESSHHQIILASRLDLNLPQPPKKFFRHGWQSWTLTAWLDPSDPPSPIRAPEFRAKDEDPAYAFHRNHVSAWVSAAELEGEDDILLVGALNLSGRVELSDHSLRGFYEDGHEGEWLIARGKEDEVFAKYANLLGTKFGETQIEETPRVWCSWYSLYKWINEPLLVKVLNELGDLPFDVFQIDDGWQVSHGDWEANKNFPNGMSLLAEKIKATGRTAGIWLAPFMVLSNAQLVREHPDWLLRDEHGRPVPAGISWGGTTWALDSSHPGVLDWLDQLIRKVVGWGYNYFKLDFLYQGALVGKRYKDIPREEAYRNALQVMRNAAGEAYILACGAPVIPSLGLCDGIRIGPDVTNFWINRPLTTWLNNPNESSTANAIRTCIHRLWLKPLVNIDPDVMYFRSKYNALKPHEQQLLEDLGTITGFRATSDLPWWWKASERDKVREFLESDPTVRRLNRYEYQIDGRAVDFSPAVPIPEPNMDFPIWLAKNWGVLKIARYQVLPAVWESIRN
ncbi:MAG: alpha-galactosidase [Anaerolineales bacterium]|nr:alpha-galactosidase [Anaerolineae bacterium]PWB77981.1 MAG: alpha-galactosidase [Anaerolineales bacterium]